MASNEMKEGKTKPKTKETMYKDKYQIDLMDLCVYA